ncbi:AAEL017115-PA [Aedes aegypti]|uniref:AAEL017115-PA n=1 Tax=Aedes aegypti TaxID=7159 RepID=J9HG35_AEDAE|nr:AAEL017115-PA [Aedes aegypti]
MFGPICVVLLGLGASLGLNAVYVNNHKIDKYDVDKIKLLTPAPTSDHVTKINLITKDNFTNPLHYYQYLVGSDPGGHVELLWGNNKTYLPTIFRSSTTTEPSIAGSINYADDLSSMENTLNNTTPIYKGDYHVEQIQAPSTTTARPVRRLKKPTRKTPIIRNQTQISEKTLELLRKYFTVNCTLTPIQEPSTTPMPKIATSTKKPKAKIKKIKNSKTTALGSTTATTTARPFTKKVKATKHKKPFEQVVYVDPPVISTISGVLEKIYNYMEDAFVSTEYISIEDDEVQEQRKHLALQAKKIKNGKKIKRNSVGELKPELTTAPSAFTSKQYQEDNSKRVTMAEIPLIDAVQANKNKLTTNIHVTSEYSPATPATVSFLPPAVVDDKDGSSEESDEGDYYEGFSNTSYEEDEDDEEDDDGSQEDEENSEEYDESVEAAGNQAGGVVNDKDYDYEDNSSSSYDKTKVKVTHQPTGGEDYSDEESEEYDSGEDTSTGPGSFFSGLFSSIGRFVRSLGFGPRTTVEYDDYDETRSTTPRIVDLKKRPTRSTSNLETQTQIERVHDATEKQQAWYHYPPYLYNEIEEPEIQLPAIDANTVPEQSIEHDWFNFMTPWDFFNPWIPWDNSPITESSADPIEITLAPTVTTTTESSAGWLPNLFGGDSSAGAHLAKPTTPKPLIPFLPASDPLQKPENWFGVIAQHVFTTTRKPRSTTPPPSTTHLTKPTKVHYSGYQLWRVYPRTAEHMRSLEDYRLSPEGVKLQWWKGPSLRGANDILVPPHMVKTFGEYLQDEDMSKEIVIRNLGQAIQYENPKMTRREQIEIEVLNGHPLTWYRYHRYADLTKFMNYLGRRFAKNVELIHIGRSFEGRPLTVVKVRFDGKRSLAGKMSNSKFLKGKKSKRKNVVKRREQRPAVFIEAGAHGREWLGPSVATWILDSLTKAISNNDTDLESIKSMDWYVLPVFNPDGYEYSHEYDRMWRKSRSKHQETQSSGILSTALNWLQSQSSLSVDSDQGCIGTDLNRNWDHRWNEEGASKSACSEYYSGYKAFSELETRALSKFLMQARRNIQIYLSLHSYGQTISYPDRKRSTGSERFGDVHEMAAVAVEALRGSGSHVSYQVDSEGEMSYPSSGTSVEFARYEAGIKYTYSVDLPDTGTHGFLFPPSGIENTAKDTFELIKGMVDYI